GVLPALLAYLIIEDSCSRGELVELLEIKLAERAFAEQDKLVLLAEGEDVRRLLIGFRVLDREAAQMQQFSYPFLEATRIAWFEHLKPKSSQIRVSIPMSEQAWVSSTYSNLFNPLALEIESHDGRCSRHHRTRTKFRISPDFHCPIGAIDR